MSAGKHIPELLEGVFDMLAPHEKIVWAGHSHPRFPVAITLADLACLFCSVAVWQAGWNVVLFGMMAAFMILLFFNVVCFAEYSKRHGQFYICTDRRYLTAKRTWTGKVKFVSIPRRVVEYIGIQKCGLILYNDIISTRHASSLYPQGFKDLDNAQEALQTIESSECIPVEPEEVPEPLRLGDSPLPAAQRELIERVLEKGEKLYYAAQPVHRFGIMQLLSLAATGLVGWAAVGFLGSQMGKEDTGYGSLIVCFICVTIFFGLMMLIAAIPFLSWRHRCTTLFFLTDRRACELDLKSGKVLQTWEATPELIKKATLYRNGNGSFIFSLDRKNTTRGDAADSEGGVDHLPHARQLVGIINALPETACPAGMKKHAEKVFANAGGLV